MTETLWKLLGAGPLRPGDAGVRFEFGLALTAWVWAGAVCACVALAIWSYWKLDARRPLRIGLAAVRAAALILIITLAAGPRLVRREERVDPDWTVVLVDRSQSMTVADAPAPAAPGTTREAQLRAALEAARAPIAGLSSERRVLWMGLGAGGFPLPAPGEAGIPDLGRPEARRTALNDALDEALRQLAGRPVAGVVVMSDGRTSDPPTRSLLRKLDAAQIPVIVVPLGTAGGAPDISVELVDAPTVAFPGDPVPVRARVRRSGGANGAVSVELVDRATGDVLDSGEIGASDEPTGEVTLAGVGDAPGAREWIVRAIPSGRDLVDENNRVTADVTFVDVPIRVVYIDGYPRWDHRYLKSLLTRESSFRSAVMLLASDKQFLQEGSDPLASVPVSPGDFEPIDVLILGDVRAELFSDEQLDALRDHVANRGAGLLWIGGPAATPSSWAGRPLADLLPMRVGGVDGAPNIPAWPGPVTLRALRAADQVGLLRLGERATDPFPEALTDPRTGWSQLRWAQWIDPASLKPTAEVLAEAVSITDGSAAPLVISMRFGAGRVMYVGTDETWRWRFGRGEAVYERFWLPIIRALARERIARAGHGVSIDVSPARARAGEPVRIEVRVLDQRLLEGRAPDRPVSIRVGRDGPARDPGRTVQLAPGGPGSWSGVWSSPEPGDFRVELADASLGAPDVQSRIRVDAADDELLEPQADHELLARLAAQTGGSVVMPGEISTIPGLLPNREVRTQGEPERRTLWDTPAALVALITLLGAEWLVRRLSRLA